ncbi:glycosyltransferase family 4 protein [Haloarcula sp. GH36]|uniref:glycosyltransferase family 4 protein n=1 Tax=Haloarcula montana TaxID=3111776 RepID=UPI002D77DCB5|nr:glycosyltransferase family 4 protein [Haloarcula sp. GH36]
MDSLAEQEPDPRPQAGDHRRVLNLVTTRTTFYTQQIEALDAIGVTSRTLAVPGSHNRDDQGGNSRSLTDYLRFYPTALSESFGRYDLIHANYGLTGPVALAQPNKKVVLSLWGSDLYGRYAAVSELCARLADAVIVMSEEMAAAVPADCHVIPHGVDFELFRPIAQSTAQSDLGWDPDVAHVLFPYATSRPEKDFPRAERVVEAAREQIDGRVELHAIHGVDHDRIPVYMNAADTLLLTSKHEGSPNSVKEALACGLPVVSTDVGDVRERLAGVSPGGVGQTTAELTAELLEVLRQPGRRSNGREQARDLSLERMARRIDEVYDSVLS